MKITEWFARAVAAGLMSDDENLWCDQYHVSMNILKGQFVPLYNFTQPFGLQLRSNGKDLYSLEWRKPTEQDVGKMCWFYDNCRNTITLAKLTEIDNKYSLFYRDIANAKYCLLADHGQIAPTEADFKRIYGE